MSVFSSIDGNQRIPAELDYKEFTANPPNYKWNKLTSQEGSQFIGLTSALTGETTYDIPAEKVHKMGGFKLKWKRNIAPQTARYTWVFADTIGDIRNIVCYDDNNTEMFNMKNFFQKYIKVIRPYNTPLNDMLTKDPKCQFYPSLEVPGAGQRSDGTPNNIPIYEQRHYRVSSAVNTLYTELCELDFSELPESYFEMNKDIVYPTKLHIKITWAGDKVGYSSLLGNTPTGGTPLALATGNISGATDYSSAVTNIEFWYQEQINETIRSGLINQMKGSGLRYMVPFINPSMANRLAGDQHSVVIDYGPNHGKYYKKHYHAVFNTIERDNPLAYDHNNLGATTSVAGKVTKYYTKIDENQMQVNAISCTQDAGEDYMYNKRVIDKSVAGATNNTYSYNHVHIDSFDEQANALQKSLDPLSQNTVIGIPMIKDIKYTWFGDVMTGAAFNHYDFPVFYKELIITKDMISFK